METSSRISFSSLPSSAHRYSPDATEIVVAYKKDSARLAKRLGAAPESARAALKRHLERTDKDSWPCFSIYYTEGGRSNHLLIPRGASSFELQTQLRKNLASHFDAENAQDLTLDLSGLDVNEARRVLLDLACLALMTPWAPDTFGKRNAKKATRKNTEFRVVSKLPAKEVKAIAEKAVALSEATNLVRTLADLPANHLNPKNYRERAKAFAAARKMETEFFNVEALRKKGAGAFIAVVQADPDTASGIFHLRIPAKSKRPRKTIALVGKGLCYDTGGYNVKTGDYMNGMHRDMTGSAIALASAGLLAQLRPDIEVHAYLALAENLISPTGYKPDEVVLASNGISIEVVNTDAEGRMVLADTLALASSAKPDLIIDYATLTGSAIRALDTRRSAVFSNRHALANLAVRCGDSSGERTWSFPIGGDYREELKSKVADILQCCMGRNADHIYAATFLSEFVDAEVPWVHMDLAAAANQGGLGLASSETTGFGVRWTLEFVEAFLKAK